jgi:F-type H+-transporting ATP synthase subunit e
MVSATVNVCPKCIIMISERLLTGFRAWRSQVVRYSALVGGIAYGVFHRRTLQAQKDKQDERIAQHHRQQLIADAKKAWQEQQQSKKGGGTCIDTYGDLACLTSSYS